MDEKLHPTLCLLFHQSDGSEIPLENAEESASWSLVNFDYFWFGKLQQLQCPNIDNDNAARFNLDRAGCDNLPLR